jgi:hypothetical protein
MAKIQETQLPGVGVRHEFQTEAATTSAPSRIAAGSATC